MGFDLYGVKAETKTGEPMYFRNNVWWWRPLATYVVELCNLNAAGWFTDDGMEITEALAVKIADALDAELKSGRTAKYSKAYAMRLKSLPLVPCEICKGSGRRNDNVIKGKCNGCEGTGKRKAWETNYPFSVANVREFARYCRKSGGFKIC